MTNVQTAGECLRVWSECVVDYYDGSSEMNSTVLFDSLRLETKLVEEFGISPHFLQGAEDFATRENTEPLTMEQTLFQDWTSRIVSGELVSLDLEDTYQVAYVEGMEWWFDNVEGMEE